MKRTEVLKAITEYYESGDLAFIETVNNITYRYKVQMKQHHTRLKIEGSLGPVDRIV